MSLLCPNCAPRPDPPPGTQISSEPWPRLVAHPSSPSPPTESGCISISGASSPTPGHYKGPQLEGQLIQPALPSALPSFQLRRHEVNTDIVCARLPEDSSGSKPPRINGRDCGSDAGGSHSCTQRAPALSSQGGFAHVGWNLQPLSVQGYCFPDKHQRQLCTGPNRN